MSASIQSIIYKGYGIAATALQGASFGQYRPVNAVNPLSPGNLVQFLPAVFDTDPAFKFLKPQIAGKNLWYVLIDGTQVQVFDYLVGSTTGPGNMDTWFVSAMYPNQPIQVIQCNAVLSVFHPAGNSGVGAQPYGGSMTTTEIMTAWPGSVIQGTKGEKGDSLLPRDVRMPWYAIFVPAAPGVTIQAADVIADTTGRRYEVSSCELTPAGWRLTAILAQT